MFLESFSKVYKYLKFSYFMGRIKTMLIKRTGIKLYKKYPDKFLPDFEHNKKALVDVVELQSKKLRNVIAGYLTHLAKEKK